MNGVGELIEATGGVVRLACDTEFQGVRMLTTQFAGRLPDGSVAVQLYRSGLAPVPPPDFSLQALQRAVQEHCQRLILRPVKDLTPALSPVRVITDLYQLKGIKPASRYYGDGLWPYPRSPLPLTLILIAHFWRADFFRAFGRQFFGKLVLARTEHDTGLAIQGHKLLGFREVGKHRYADPVLEYVKEPDMLHPVRVRTFDTALAFGKGGLDDHARTFLDVGKCATITSREKARMATTFAEKTREAYLYAIWDAVLTLLVEERMREEDRRMYIGLSFEEKDVPALRSPQGSRVAETILKSIAKDCAVGSVLLSQRGKLLKDGSVGKPSMSKIKAQLSQGAGERIAAEKLSRFGRQTGDTHGGLTLSRSPTKFFHEARGQLYDVDLSGCYGAILASLNLYIGRPVLLEPGDSTDSVMTLKDAIAFTDKHAAGPDAWIIKVSGGVKGNILVPSTKSALTNANFNSPSAQRRARNRRYGFVFDWVLEDARQSGNTAIFTDVIEAGIITHATWLMIKALPPAWREQYERLQVDTLLFYPAELVADSGPEYDRLRKKLAHEGTAWSSQLDMHGLRRITVEKLDDEYVSLRYPIGQLTSTILAKRQEAKEEHGKGSAAEKGWKQHANSMYGVTASRHLTTNNIILANVITATARALAFAMHLSLNGIQVITDGCTYRRDQVPDCTLADCLAVTNDYPIQRIEAGVPFYDPATIPSDDTDFTEWYRHRHVLRFFGVNGPEYEELFKLHRLEHKTCGEPAQPAFDGLCCDGASNYLKLLIKDEEWHVADMKARSYSKEAMTSSPRGSWRPTATTITRVLPPSRNRSR